MQNSITETPPKTITTEEFDRLFDDGEDISDYVDWSSARPVNHPPKRVNIDMPAWMVTGLDREAKRLGITRQSVMKTWLAERLDNNTK